ncbi:gamma-aminobutyric acid type B receptor subunit 2-like isoform X2 [Corythoichthys intestinalis]|uniref:gamma-aminobutyric acid type B receptor subunit 2-like isoform X2 n=1 Tax=Corythoichthys intestinalis TaxID=161448 RepID=UPI0025A4E32E|nr:gamma-aminobutyric acid type B receptor subunit 2-like isoform X2 [Corythoichthys intestinalis]
MVRCPVAENTGNFTRCPDVTVSYKDQVACGGNVFGVAPSGRVVHRAAAALLRRFGWTRVGLVTPRVDSEMTEDLMSQMDVRPVSTATLPDLDCGGLLEMQKRDVRIIVIIVGLLQANEDWPAQVFCCASRLGMFGARHQWIVAGGHPTRMSGSLVAGCASHDLTAAADGAIWLSDTLDGHSDTPSISGRTRGDLERAYRREVRRHAGSQAGALHAYAYDAVWVAAIALSRLAEAQKRRRILEGNVGEEDAIRALRTVLARTRFRGVTGSVSFRRGRRLSSIHVVQTQGRAGVSVGEFDGETDRLRLSARQLKFIGSSAPRDGTEGVGILGYGILSTAAAVTGGVSLIVLCAARRPSSRDAPTTTAAMAAVLLSAASVVAAGPDGDVLGRETAHALCSLRTCLLCSSHTLASSWLLSYMWRRSASGADAPAAWRLAPLFTSADILLLSVWLTANRSQIDLAMRSASECRGDGANAWSAAVFAYKAPLLACGFLLSFLTPGQNHVDARPAHACAAWLLWASTWATSALPAFAPLPEWRALDAAALACDVVVITVFARLLFERDGELVESEDGAVEDEELLKLRWRLERQNAELDTQKQALCAQLSEAEIDQHRSRNSEATSSCDNHDVNSPELVRRRLSLQLPILHLSYLPAVGGVSASSSAHFDA